MNFLNRRHFPCLIHTPLLNLTRPTFQKNQFRVPLIKLHLPSSSSSLYDFPRKDVSKTYPAPPSKKTRRNDRIRRVSLLSFSLSSKNPCRKQGKQRYVSRDLGIGFPYRCLPPSLQISRLPSNHSQRISTFSIIPLPL